MLFIFIENNVILKYTHLFWVGIEKYKNKKIKKIYILIKTGRWPVVV